MWTCTLDGPATGQLASIASAFAERNAGYALSWAHGVRELAAKDRVRVAFLQGGDGEGNPPAQGRVGDATSPMTVGDLILLGPGASLRVDRPVDLLVFELPGPLPPGVPTFLRPDHDPLLTDTPGGCAEEEGAYRRLVLTWRADAGPYVCHELNAHRVRMWDSFSHYHPVDGGFEELYLVQHAPPGARLHWAPNAQSIERSAEWTREQAGSWMQTLPLVAGQLVVIPRGTMHRAVGGALAQVITVPGFVPRREIGLDPQLREIQERFRFEGDRAIAYRGDGSEG